MMRRTVTAAILATAALALTGCSAAEAPTGERDAIYADYSATYLEYLSFAKSTYGDIEFRYVQFPAADSDRFCDRASNDPEQGSQYWGMPVVKIVGDGKQVVADFMAMYAERGIEFEVTEEIDDLDNPSVSQARYDYTATATTALGTTLTFDLGESVPPDPELFGVTPNVNLALYIETACFPTPEVPE